MSDAWIAFARSGDPHHPGLPHWPAFAANSVPTMLFDHPTKLVINPEGAKPRSIG